MDKMVAKLLFTFLKIGLLSIGGGYAVIPLIKEQVVDTMRWLTAGEFTDIITISQMTPGPLAVNTSTFVGIRLSGLAGAAAATFGCVFSGFCISLALYRFFRSHTDSAYVLQVLKGLKASSLGLIASAAASILSLALLKSSDTSAFVPDLTSVAFFAVSLTMLRKFRANPMAVLAAAGAAGYLARFVFA